MFEGKNTARVSFSVSECIDKDMRSLSFSVKNTETDAPQPVEATQNPAQSSNGSRPGAEQSSSAQNDERATDSVKSGTDNSRTQSQTQTQARGASAADSAGTNPQRASDSREEGGIEPNGQNTDGASVPDAQSPTTDSATADESGQTNDYSIWIVIFVVLCMAVIAVTVVINIKRRKKHEK